MRGWIGALCLLLTACATMRERAPSAEEVLLREAIAAAGGEAALSQAKVLVWTGEATVLAGGRRIELGVESRIEPFVRARSDTWLREQGRASLRTLVIDSDGGWTVRDGQRTPMPDAMLRHERLQYATYGLMRLVTLRDPGVVLRRLPATGDGLRGLHVEHPQAAPTDLYFDAHGRLVVLTNVVPSPDGGAPVAQRFEFAGNVEGGGVRWPRTLRILQNGEPYFELRLATFTPAPR